MKLITSEMLGVELRHNYYIDEHGNIFSEYSNKFLTHERTKNGYLRVEIQGKHYLVHRLVAMAFLGIKSNGYEVNHKDQNPENNDIDNLEWVTCSENQYHAFEIGLKPKNFNHPFSKFTKEDILYIRNNYQKNKKGFGIRTLARKYGVCDSTIRQIVVGITYKDIK